MRKLKQNTAVDVTIGRARDGTTGALYTGSLVVADITLSKNDGAFAAKNEATNPAHKAGGNYTCKLNSTDTNTLGILFMAIDHSGVYSWNEIFEVVSAAEWDHVHGSTPQPVNATQISGDSVAADNLEAAYDGAGYAGGTIKQQVDAVAISGDTVAADNCEAMFDGTGYAGGTIKLLTESASTDTVKLALIIRENTAQAGVAGSITLDAGASSVTDFYKNQLVVITSGTGVGQARFISAYNGTTKVATVSENWATTPDGTSVFKVLAIRASDSTLSTSGIADAVWDEAISGHNSAGTFGRSLSDIRQRHAGKVRMNSQTGVLTIYEIDGATTRYTLTKAAVDGVTSDMTPS